MNGNSNKTNSEEPQPTLDYREYRECIIWHIPWNYPTNRFAREEVASMLDWRKSLIQEVLAAYPQLTEAEALEMLLTFGS
jgi:hypothetical protein